MALLWRPTQLPLRVLSKVSMSFLLQVVRILSERDYNQILRLSYFFTKSL